MHLEAYTFVHHVVRTCRLPRGLVVEIGGRNVNGTIRDHFPRRRYLATDVAPGPGVDVVADGATLTLSQRAAVVVCAETLEHTAHGADICANAFRLLRDDGVFIVTAAGDGRAPHSAIDGGPILDGEYYGNVSRADLTAWLAPFPDVQVYENPVAHDIYAVAAKTPGTLP